MKNQKPTLALSVILVLTLCFACKKDSSKSNQVSDSITVMTNGADPLVTRFTQKGDQIDFFGERDILGEPQTINQIILNNPNDTSFYYIDQLGRPSQVLSQNGAQFDFNWISSNRVIISILSSTGESQLISELDLTSNGSRLSSRTTGTSSRIGKKISFQPISVLENKPSIDLRSGQNNSFVNLSSCGEASDGQVLLLTKGASNNTEYYPASRVQKGFYGASIPLDPNNSINITDVCGSLATLLNQACIVNSIPNLPSLICNNVSNLLEDSGLDQVTKNDLLTACNSITNGIQQYCNAINQGGSQGLTSLTQRICEAESQNRSGIDIKSIFAKAVVSGQSFVSNERTVNSADDFPITIDFNTANETTIRALTLQPSSPLEDEDYDVICDLICLKAGSTINISIIGTDGYEDEIEYFINNDTPSGRFLLDVPGAEGGVRDVITLKITLPDGTSLQRTASLIFR